jgi:hypothetical protein
MMRRPPLGSSTAYRRFSSTHVFIRLALLIHRWPTEATPISATRGPALRSSDVTAASTRCTEGRTNVEAKPHRYAHCREAGDGHVQTSARSQNAQRPSCLATRVRDAGRSLNTALWIFLTPPAWPPSRDRRARQRTSAPRKLRSIATERHFTRNIVEPPHTPS